jgi:membrane protein YqaA with SNARE-associated domain
MASGALPPTASKSLAPALSVCVGGDPRARTAEASSTVDTRSWVARYARPILGLLATLAVSVGILFIPMDYRAMGDWGYVGVFMVTLLATAALVLPVPYLSVIVLAGSFLNPVAVALLAGCAAALGELTGYFLGRSGRNLLPHNRWTNMLERGMGRAGLVVIFLGAAIPNPLFDAIGVVAGATRFGVWKFLITCFLGKTLRFWILAFAGGAFFS